MLRRKILNTLVVANIAVCMLAFSGCAYTGMVAGPEGDPVEVDRQTFISTVVENNQKVDNQREEEIDSNPKAEWNEDFIPSGRVSEMQSLLIEIGEKAAQVQNAIQGLDLSANLDTSMPTPNFIIEGDQKNGF